MNFAVTKRFIVVSAALFVALWLFMLMAVLSSDGTSMAVRNGGIESLADGSSISDTSGSSGTMDSVNGDMSDGSSSGSSKVVKRKPIELHRSVPDLASSSSSTKSMELRPLSPPKRYIPPPQTGIEPPSIAEVERNITIFLRTLHDRLSSLASSQINPIDALNAYMDVTKNTLLKWDDMNKDRYWKQRR